MVLVFPPVSFSHDARWQVEAARRAKGMVATMDSLGFGNCTNTGACEIECP